MQTTDDLRAQELREMGYPGPLPPPVGPLPAGGGRWAVEHHLTMAAIMNWASRTYRWSFDAALQDSYYNAQKMRADPVIYRALRDRQRPVCQLDWYLEPRNDADPHQVTGRERVTRALKKTPRFNQLKRCLLEAQFLGRYGIFLLFDWDDEGDHVVSNWRPVHGDKIVFKWSGDPGILVNPSAYQGDWEPTDRGPAHFLSAGERETFLWHEFEPEDVDYWDGQSAGQLHGLGLRGRLYYWWWLRNNLMSILMDFLDKVGTGITIFFYEAGDAASEAEVKKAIENQPAKNVFLFPRNRDGQSAYAGPGIQRIEVGMAGANVFLDLFNLINDTLRGAILGEELTTVARPTGIGSGASDAQETTAEQRVKYDARDLEDSLQPLVNVLYRYNCPGTPPGYFRFGIDRRNPVEAAQAAQVGYEMGLDLDADEVRDELGLRRPEPGHAVLSKLAEMQPTAQSLSGVPEGVPMAGEPGPSENAQAA